MTFEHEKTNKDTIKRVLLDYFGANVIKKFVKLGAFIKNYLIHKKRGSLEPPEIFLFSSHQMYNKTSEKISHSIISFNNTILKNKFHFDKMSLIVNRNSDGISVFLQLANFGLPNSLFNEKSTYDY